MPSEKSSLLPSVDYSGSVDVAAQLSGMLGQTIAVVQIIAAVVFLLLFSYDSVDNFTTEKYIIFRDIMVMLLLGFGYCKYLFSFILW